MSTDLDAEFSYVYKAKIKWS